MKTKLSKEFNSTVSSKQKDNETWHLPGGHLHSYEYLSMCLQVPPFWHGDGEQGMYFDSQFLPAYPGGHMHLQKK